MDHSFVVTHIESRREFQPHFDSANAAFLLLFFILHLAERLARKNILAEFQLKKERKRKSQIEEVTREVEVGGEVIFALEGEGQ
ncbi:hypothetical protein RUM44_009077 [Polyplax serrata]|uniref:Uncharacterized protein n=1 Tax=Polyplax serrata TaxID=468196 RepID=A0ABR1AT65_POLSC